MYYKILLADLAKQEKIVLIEPYTVQIPCRISFDTGAKFLNKTGKTSIIDKILE